MTTYRVSVPLTIEPLAPNGLPLYEKNEKAVFEVDAQDEYGVVSSVQNSFKKMLKVGIQCKGDFRKFWRRK
jgi:hypothetical protein